MDGYDNKQSSVTLIEMPARRCSIEHRFSTRNIKIRT